MTAALLVMRIQVADFYELAASVLPLNLHIDVVHIDLLSQPDDEQCRIISTIAPREDKISQSPNLPKVPRL